MRPSLHRPRGFTLIEQLAVITTVGATSVVALPQFIEISTQAEATALASVAAAAGSAMVLNRAGCMVTGQVPVADKCAAVSDCAQVAGLLMAGLPPGYQVPTAPIGPGICTVVQDNTGRSAVFVGLLTGG